MPRIYAEARRAYRQYRSGVSGQTVTDADNPDFLLVMAAWQMFVGLNGERQDGKNRRVVTDNSGNDRFHLQTFEIKINEGG